MRHVPGGGASRPGRVADVLLGEVGRAHEEDRLVLGRDRHRAERRDGLLRGEHGLAVVERPHDQLAQPLRELARSGLVVTTHAHGGRVARALPGGAGGLLARDELARVHGGEDRRDEDEEGTEPHAERRGDHPGPDGLALDRGRERDALRGGRRDGVGRHGDEQQPGEDGEGQAEERRQLGEPVVGAEEDRADGRGHAQVDDEAPADRREVTPQDAGERRALESLDRVRPGVEERTAPASSTTATVAMA